MKRAALLVLDLAVAADIVGVAALVLWLAWGRADYMSDTDRAYLAALLTKASILEAARQRASKAGDVTLAAR